MCWLITLCWTLSFVTVCCSELCSLLLCVGHCHSSLFVALNSSLLLCVGHCHSSLFVALNSSLLLCVGHCHSSLFVALNSSLLLCVVHCHSSLFVALNSVVCCSVLITVCCSELCSLLLCVGHCHSSLFVALSSVVCCSVLITVCCSELCSLLLCVGHCHSSLFVALSSVVCCSVLITVCCSELCSLLLCVGHCHSSLFVALNSVACCFVLTFSSFACLQCSTPIPYSILCQFCVTGDGHLQPGDLDSSRTVSCSDRAGVRSGVPIQRGQQQSSQQGWGCGQSHRVPELSPRAEGHTDPEVFPVSACLSVHLSQCLSVHLSLCLSISLSCGVPELSPRAEDHTDPEVFPVRTSLSVFQSVSVGTWTLTKSWRSYGSWGLSSQDQSICLSVCLSGYLNSHQELKIIRILRSFQSGPVYLSFSLSQWVPELSPRAEDHTDPEVFPVRTSLSVFQSVSVGTWTLTKSWRSYTSLGPSGHYLSLCPSVSISVCPSDWLNSHQELETMIQSLRAFRWQPVCLSSLFKWVCELLPTAQGHTDPETF